MRIWPPRCEIALKDDVGMIHFGKTEWVEGDLLSCQLDGSPAADNTCDVTLKIADRNLAINAQARVVKTEPGDFSQVRVALTLLDMPAAQREVWDGWLTSVSASMSGSFARGSFEGERSGRRIVGQALRGGMRSPIPPPPVPIPALRPKVQALGTAPTYRVRWNGTELLEIHWPSVSTFAASWNDTLRKGRLTVPSRGSAASVAVQLHLPDGQVLRLVGRIDRGGKTALLRFTITPALRHKLSRAALA